MSPEMIERCVERRIDALDRTFLSSSMSQETYDAEIKAIDRWSVAEYRKAGHAAEAV